MEDDIRTWEEGDETTPPDERIIDLIIKSPNYPSPETEAEEI
jgi:hypothetical protein